MLAQRQALLVSSGLHSFPNPHGFRGVTISSATFNISKISPYTTRTRFSTNVSSLLSVQSWIKPLFNTWSIPEHYVVLGDASMNHIIHEVCRCSGRTGFTRDLVTHHDHIRPHLAGQRVLFFLATHEPSQLLRQMSILKAVSQHRVKSLEIVIPYDLSPALSHSTVVTRLNSYGVVQPMPKTLFAYALDHISTYCGGTRWGLCFPSKSSYQNLYPMVQQWESQRQMKLPHVISYPSEISALDHVVMVNDVVHSGHTLHECHMWLKRCGVKRVSAYVTHATFAAQSCEKFFTRTGEWSGLECFWISNSLPVSHLHQRAPFRVLSIVPTLMKHWMDQCQITPPRVPVYLSSEAHVKKTALDLFLRDAMPWCEPVVSCRATDSGVSAQPLNEEVRTGCQNREKNLQQSMNFRPGVYVSMESGIRTGFTGLQDVQGVQINGIYAENGIPSMMKPAYYQEWQRRRVNEPMLTVGHVYAQHETVDHQDFHALSGRSRGYWLYETLKLVS